MFVAHLVSDKEDEFSGLEGLCVQLVALRFTRNITGSRGLNLLSVSLSLHYFLWVSLSSPTLLRCALTRFSPKLCLGPE